MLTEQQISTIFHTLWLPLTHYAEKIIKNKRIAEEIVQDVFVAVNKLDYTPQKFLCFEITKRLCINYAKSKQGKLERKIETDNWFIRDEPLVEEDVEVIKSLLLVRLYEAIENLPPRMKWCIELYLKGFTRPQIVVIMGVSKETVHATRYAALQRLRLSLFNNVE